MNSITAKLEMEAKHMQKMNKEESFQHKTPQKKEKDIEDDSDRDTDGEEKKMDVSISKSSSKNDDDVINQKKISDFGSRPKTDS